MLYVTGDTHGDFSRFKKFKKDKELTKDDYVLILGDAGILWTEDLHNRRTIKHLDKLPFTTLFVEGNHTCYPKYKLYPTIKWNGGNVTMLSDSVIHLQRGQVFTIDNKKIFTFGGALSIDRQYRIKDVTWFEEEVPNYKEEIEGLINLELNSYKVDYIFSHDCSESIFQDILYKYKLWNLGTYSLRKYFENISKIVDFRHWYFGHYHYDYDITEKYTLLFKEFRKVW